jgi:1-acyl-sn-glycerol-3-phosphate acyltransferase
MNKFGKSYVSSGILSGGFLYLLSHLMYQFLKRYYFRKISVTGQQHLPTGKPLILAANHNNAFLDSILLHVTLNQNIYSIARGDAFNRVLYRYFLRIYHVLPIYRKSEGSENLHKNEESFSLASAVLEKNLGPLLIFPEGTCVQEKKVRPLKKGMARIAFKAAEAKGFEEEVYIVPVGINYSRFTKAFGSIHLAFHRPIKVSDYRNMYEENEAKAITSLTRDTELLLKNVVEEALPPLEAPTLITLLKMKKKELQGMEKIRFCKSLSELLDKEKSGALGNACKDYEKLLGRHKISDGAIASIKEKSLGFMLYSSLLIALAFPLALLSLVAGGLPMFGGIFLSTFIPIGREFKASFHTAFVFLIILMQSLSVCMIGLSLSLFIPTLAFIVLQFPAMLMLREYAFLCSEFYNTCKLWWLKQTKPLKVKAMLNGRKEVLSLLNQ